MTRRILCFLFCALACLASLAHSETAQGANKCEEAKEKGPAADKSGQCKGYAERPEEAWKPLFACLDSCRGPEGFGGPNHNRCTDVCSPQREAGRAAEDAWKAKMGQLEYLCSVDKKLRSKAQCPASSAERAAAQEPAIRLYAKNPGEEKAKAEAARVKAQNDEAAYNKAQQQKMAQARADEELKRLDQDLKQRQACMKPEARGLCSCARFYPPPPPPKPGEPARGCSQ